jgi:hypothetical protein
MLKPQSLRMISTNFAIDDIARIEHDPEAKRLRHVSSGELADAIGALEARVEVLKAEAIRRELRRAEGEAYRIVLAGAALWTARLCATARLRPTADGRRVRVLEHQHRIAGGERNRSARGKTRTCSRFEMTGCRAGDEAGEPLKAGALDVGDGPADQVEDLPFARDAGEGPPPRRVQNR